LNEIVELAQGKWIARMDADDIALPHRFERQLEWLEKTGADICGSWIKLFGTPDRRILKRASTDEAIKVELLFRCSFAHSTVMMKTDLLKHLKYDKAWEGCEDYDLWERAAHAGWRMTNVPEVLLLYRQHEAQISTSISARQQELTQKVRSRYWMFCVESMQLDREWIDEVLILCGRLPVKVDMNSVDLAFNVLLEKSHGETRATVLDCVTQLYLWAAPNCQDVVTRWQKMNLRYGHGLGLETILKLKFLSLFRFNLEGKFFQSLKQYYFYLRRN
jgi:glycosyltransferase involved in cell wall biosynthesis